MNPLHRSSARSAILPPLARYRVAAVLAQSVALAALALPIGGCSSANVAKVEAATKVVSEDATSAAGQQLLADVTSAALQVGLDIASGNDPGAAVAGIQGAASAVRDYEGLPVAPASAVIARAAAAGSGVATVASALTPSVETLVSDARKSATQQKVNISTDEIIEAVARGFDSVATTRSAPLAH